MTRLVFAPGRIGQALALDGKSYVDVKDEARFDFTDAYTIAMWFKSDEFTRTFEALITKGKGGAWGITRSQAGGNLLFRPAGRCLP